MKYLFSLFTIALFLTNCGSDLPSPSIDSATQLQNEITDIKDYLVANNLTAEETNSGLHYIIEEKGSGSFIDENTEINIILKGYFLDGTTFDGTVECTPATFRVSQLIPGLIEGITNFNVGGKGTLLIPSALAFGQNGNGPIPSNATVIFEFELVDLEPFEIGKMKAYLAEKGLTADSTASGIYYIISEPGEGEHPTVNSTVTVNYKGYYLYGDTFDQSTTPATFELNSVILGWQEAIPLLKPGGKATFLIPSGRGYGSVGTQGIPGNSVLIFDVELIEFRN